MDTVPVNMSGVKPSERRRTHAGMIIATKMSRKYRANNDTTVTEAMRCAHERHSPSEKMGSDILERRRRSGMNAVSAEGSAVMLPS
jgi:hypothetical protein